MAAPSPQRVPLLAAVAIVVGSMIGTGVFGSLGFQLADIPSGFPVLLLWILGGLIAACGAVNYAELAAAFPQSGGEYHLLGKVYHPAAGFLSGWVSLTVGFPAPVAVAALFFGRYAIGALGMDPEASDGLARGLACGAVVVLTSLHLISISGSGRIQMVLSGLKILLVAGLAVCGFLLPPAQPVSFLPVAGDSALTWQAAFPVSLVYVLYAYSGWNAACYITGEVERPERNVPRALLLGTGLVAGLYVALNAAFLRAAPIAELQGRPDAAQVAAHFIFGESGGRLAAGLIALGLMASISAMTWAGSRVAWRMGQDSPLLRPLARTNARGVPWVAVIGQAGLALAMILFLNADSIIVCTEFTLQLILLLAVWGVIHLRVRQPDLPRPCRAWGYPFTTIAFLIAIVFVLAFVLYYKHHESMLGLANLCLGGIAWALSGNQRRRAE